jgi:hypothetical protein
MSEIASSVAAGLSLRVELGQFAGRTLAQTTFRPVGAKVRGKVWLCQKWIDKRQGALYLASILNGLRRRAYDEIEMD